MGKRNKSSQRTISDVRMDVKGLGGEGKKKEVNNSRKRPSFSGM